MDQDELSNWVGIAPREKIPADTNCYLFSSFNPPVSSIVRVTDRAMLILIGSGFTLLTGLCLMYFPVFRHRGPLLFMAVAFIGICAWRPAATLLFLQTTIFGIILTLLAVFLARLFSSSAKVRRMDHRYLSAAPVSHGSSRGSKVHSSSLWVDTNPGEN